MKSILGKDILHNKTGKIFILSEEKNEIALFFPYEMVTPESIAHALKDAGVSMDRYKVRFYPETPQTMGKKRLGGDWIKERIPIITQLVSLLSINSEEYIYVKIEENKKEDSVLKEGFRVKLNRRQRRQNQRKKWKHS